MLFSPLSFQNLRNKTISSIIPSGLPYTTNIVMNYDASLLIQSDTSPVNLWNSTYGVEYLTLASTPSPEFYNSPKHRVFFIGGGWQGRLYENTFDIVRPYTIIVRYDSDGVGTRRGICSVNNNRIMGPRSEGGGWQAYVGSFLTGAGTPLML